METVVYTYGAIYKVCTVIRSRRKTLSISVTPHMEIVIRAPQTCPVQTVQQLLYKRRVWIKNQLKHFAKYHPLLTPRKYVSGETHMYLGRQYRLKVIKGQNTPVKLKSGYFWVGAKTPEQVQTKLYTWYLAKAKQKLLQRLEMCLQQVPNATMPTLNIRKMEKRWGSLSKNGVMTLNTNLIKAPVECIDYVIIHELCHQQHMYHSTEFWQLLENMYPNWQQAKHKMEMMLS